MHSLHFLASALLPFLTTAQIYDFDTPPKCISGLQVITTCGTFQNGYGTLQGLTQNITSLVNDSASVYLDYPANESPYFGSVNAGVANLTAYIEYFVNGCPDVKLVLLGYSQGAQVSLSTLCGWPARQNGFAGVDALASNYTDRIWAVVGYGDPTHTYPLPYDKGTSTHDGEFARPDDQCDSQASSLIASWCDNGDQFCDSCPPPATPTSYNPRNCSPAIHESYWDNYNPQASEFVLNQYRTLLNASKQAAPAASGDTTTTTILETRTLSSTTKFTSGSTTITSASTKVTVLVTTSTSGAMSSSGARPRVQPIWRHGFAHLGV